MRSWPARLVGISDLTQRWQHEGSNLSTTDATSHGRSYFAGLKVTIKRNKATILLTLTLFQTMLLTI
jgi:hypothetical protein